MSIIENLGIVCLIFIPGFLVAIVMFGRGKTMPIADDALIQAKLSDKEIEAYNAKHNTSYSTRALTETSETA